MRKTLIFIGTGLLVVILSVAFAACDMGTAGTVTLNMTDSPIEADNVDGVYVTITGISYQAGRDEGNSDWVEVADFGDPKEINLLDLVNGEVQALGDFVLPAGQINQIRFHIDAPEEGAGSGATNPGCYVSFNDGTDDAPLFVPSGAQTGYKATGSFQVPENGAVTVTADFDVRKSVVKASNRYILKPTIRLVVDDEAGRIHGSITGYTGSGDLVVYAYEDGTYTADEAVDPLADSDTSNDKDPMFPSAVSSGSVGNDTDADAYGIWYLAAGTYDLVVVEYKTDGTFSQVLGTSPDVEVSAGANTSQDIDTSTF